MAGHTWKGRAATLALIKTAAQAGVEIELEDHPTFKLIPGKPVIVDAPPSNRRLDFKRKPHMKGCTNWRPPNLVWGPLDYKLPMAGDDRELTRARHAWANGSPQQLRDYLAERKAA